jgi:hypothetical protein
MTNTRRRTIPKWKQAVALGCILYVLIGWILPIFMLPLVNILPFIHERDFLERLIVSSAGTFVVLAVLVAMDPQKIWKIAKSQVSNRTLKERFVHWASVICGFTMFTCTAAWLSANTFGLAVRILPSHPYSEAVVLESVEFGDSKYRSVTLRFKRGPEAKMHSVVLSQRLFDYPRFKAGEVLELKGEHGILGVSVFSFSQKG